MSSHESSDDLAAAARERTRQEVRAIFAATPEVAPRDCPHCGARESTRHEHCPACGKSYFVAPPRFSRTTRIALATLGTAVAVAAVTGLVVFLLQQGNDSASQQRSGRAAAVAAERRRLSREQAPHHGRAGVPLPAAGATAAARRAARRAMVSSLEATITADARGRIARGELMASGVRATECGPLASAGATPDEDDLHKDLGRYSCLAVSQSARRGAVTSRLGIPFVAVIDFRRGTFTWCKDNPVSPADIKSQLAFVRLARECTAARGPAFGSGYLVEAPTR
jgi:hypothetical protein